MYKVDFLDMPRIWVFAYGCCNCIIIGKLNMHLYKRAVCNEYLGFLFDLGPLGIWESLSAANTLY